MHDKTRELFFSFASFTERFDEYQLYFNTRNLPKRSRRKQRSKMEKHDSRNGT